MNAAVARSGPLQDPGPTPPALPALSALAAQPPESALDTLTTQSIGLTDQEAERRLDFYGGNVIAHEQPQRWYALLLENFANPFVLVLILLGAVSFLTGDVRATVTVAVMVIISVLMRFIQEFRSSKAAEALRGHSTGRKNADAHCQGENEQGAKLHRAFR